MFDISTIFDTPRQEPYTCHHIITELREYIETNYPSYNKIDLEKDLRNLLKFLEKNKIDDKSNDFKKILLENLKVKINPKLPDLNTVLTYTNKFFEIDDYVRRRKIKYNLNEQDIQFVIDTIKNSYENILQKRKNTKSHI